MNKKELTRLIRVEYATYLNTTIILATQVGIPLIVMWRVFY